jgi:predicted  nucleic acid-binding Zn-ribbon protein
MAAETDFQQLDQSMTSAASEQITGSAFSSDLETWKDFIRRDITRELEIIDINKKLSVISTEITGLKKDISGLDAKIDKLEIGLKSEFNFKLDKLETGLKSEFNSKLDKLENSFNGKLDKLENSFDGKLDKLENSFSLKFEAFTSEIKAVINASNIWKNSFIIGIFVALIGVLITLWIKV